MNGSLFIRKYIYEWLTLYRRANLTNGLVHAEFAETLLNIANVKSCYLGQKTTTIQILIHFTQRKPYLILYLLVCAEIFFISQANIYVLLRPILIESSLITCQGNNNYFNLICTTVQ